MLSPFAERQMIEKSMNTGYDISEKRVLPDRRRSALKIMGSLIGLEGGICTSALFQSCGNASEHL